MKARIVAVTIALLFGAGMSYGNVVINEFSYDDSSGDDLEFIELYNAGGAPVDMSGWTVDSNDPIGANPQIAAIPAGTMLGAGAYYLIGQAGVSPDLVSLNTMENSNETIELRDATGALIDGVIYEANKGFDATWVPADVLSVVGSGVWANATLIEPLSTAMAWSRYVDAYHTNNNGRDFGRRPVTLRGNNLGTGTAAPTFTVADVDPLAVGAAHPGLSWASFVPAQVIDPTVAGGANPNAIPPSPQGGNATVSWDPSGGGNLAVSDDVITGSGFEMFVYLDTAPYGEGGAESTTYGIKGTSGTFYNLPDPSGLLFGDVVTANGNTGIGWLFEKEDSAGLVSLKLIDFGDGGDSSPGATTPQEWIVYADIDMSGMPSGWHEISIEYDKLTGNVVAMFDSQMFNFATDMDLIGSMYIGYRESLAGAPASLRPPTFDMIPEPGAFALLALGGLALLRRR
jgi:MYXO-CTERM domain-containing protein